jgi:hypothetical protein
VSEELTSSGRATSSGWHDLSGWRDLPAGHKGVVLYCDDGHPRRFAGAVILDTSVSIFDSSGNFVRHGVSVMDGEEHLLADESGQERDRYKFNCPVCPRSLPVRAEKLERAVNTLVQHSIREVSLKDFKRSILDRI